MAAYQKLKRKLGISTPTKVLDPRFMIAVVEDEVLRRLHVDVVPLDLSVLLSTVRPDREWAARRLFDGTEVLFPPGTKIAEDASGDWILLASDGSPTAFRMPKNGYYFDDMSFNRGERIDPGSSGRSPTSRTSTCSSSAATAGRSTRTRTMPSWVGGSASVSSA